MTSIPAGPTAIDFLVYTAPAVLTLVWLFKQTDWLSLTADLPQLVLLGAPAILSEILWYFRPSETRAALIAGTHAALTRVWTVAGLFLLGPGALWIGVGLIGLELLVGYAVPGFRGSRSGIVRRCATRLALETLPLLVGFAVYLRWGGEVPTAGLQLRPLLLAIAALGVALLVRAALSAGSQAYHARKPTREPTPDPKPTPAVLPIWLALVPDPFGILTAGLYVQLGVPAYLFMTAGVLIVSMLIRRLSVVTADLTRADVYAGQLQLEQMSQELRVAGEIQSGLIPYDIPRIPGWQLAVTLKPARETSGDFFDIIPLPEGKIGLVMADVVDKGIGAALYMILSRTLLRTYAVEADSDPGLVFFATNRRMIADTTANRFVTAFYGVLDPTTGRLTYGNAGHNPPYVMRPGEKVIIQELIRTGLPIGVQAEATWSTATVQIESGDRLILYTDGIPDARNPDGQPYTIQPMLEAAKRNLGLSAEELQSVLLGELSTFVAGGTQTDDITLMVLARDPSL